MIYNIDKGAFIVITITNEAYQLAPQLARIGRRSFIPEIKILLYNNMVEELQYSLFKGWCNCYVYFCYMILQLVLEQCFLY